MMCRLLIICLLLTGAARAALIRTTPGHPLQQVLDAAQPGDTVWLAPGIYRQHDIVVRKALTITGTGFPVLDGENKYQVLIVAADSVRIHGITVQNTGRSSMTDMAGIRLQQVKDVQVTNCRLINTTYGVYLQNSAHCTVTGNFIRAGAADELSAGNGIHAWKCSHLLLQRNEISGHRDGIYFEFVTDSHIYRNVSDKNIRYGLHFMFSHNDTYSHNTFRNNGAGVAVMYTKGVTMYKNVFDHNWGDAAYGILLKDISDSRILLNRFRQNTVGIYMEGSSRILITGNEFSANGWAMRVQANCDGNQIRMNNFMQNSFDIATNGTMMLNTFSANYWDKYEGYDLGRDGQGDVPYYPVSVYSVLSEKIPAAMLLYRSFLTNMMDQAEKMMPVLTPGELRDDAPRTKKWNL